MQMQMGRDQLCQSLGRSSLTLQEYLFCLGQAVKELRVLCLEPLVILKLPAEFIYLIDIL